MHDVRRDRALTIHAAPATKLALTSQPYGSHDCAPLFRGRELAGLHVFTDPFITQ